MRSLLASLALVATTAGLLAAQQPTPAAGCCATAPAAPKPCPMMQGMTHDSGGMGMMGMNHGGQGGGMGGMMDHAMMMRMDSLGRRLDSLSAAMERATGQRKVTAMATLLAALVADHREMQRHMHEMMMKHEMGQGGGMGMGGMMNHAQGAMDCGKAAGTPAAPATPEHNH